MQKEYFLPLLATKYPAIALTSERVPVFALKLSLIESIRLVRVPSPGQGNDSIILLFLFLTKIIDNLLINISISFVFSALLNYILCIIFLFKHNAHFKTFGEILAYIITLIIMGSVDYICTLAFLNLEMNNLLSKSLSNIVGLFGNFLLRKYFVFFEKKL